MSKYVPCFFHSPHRTLTQTQGLYAYLAVADDKGTKLFRYVKIWPPHLSAGTWGAGLSKLPCLGLSLEETGLIQCTHMRSVGGIHDCPHPRDTQSFLACQCRPRWLASAVIKMHPPLSRPLRLGLCLFSSPQDFDLNPHSSPRAFICAKVPFPFIPHAHLLRFHLCSDLVPPACHQPGMVPSKQCTDLMMRVKSPNN